MAERTVLGQGLIVDGTGAEPFEGSVVVEDGRIADVVAGSAVPGGAGARVLRCDGRAVIPGLIDAHVHIGAVDVNIMGQHRRYLPSEAALRMGRILTETLLQGFTTVRDAGGADAGFRAAVERGVVAGPRLRVSGRPLSQTGGHGDDRTPAETTHPDAGIGIMGVVADGVDGVRRAAREELRRGADQIKVMASGGAMSPADRLETTQYSVDELRAIVAEAQAAGRYVLAHAYTPAAIRNAVDAGVHSVEHGNLLDAETAALMARRGVYLDPTLVTYEKLYEEGERYGVPRENLDKIATAHDAGIEGLRRAHRAGVSIASGSDLLGELARHKARELAIKASVLGPMGALVAATRTNAEMMGLADEIGTLEPGKHADLLVVDGNPLDDLSLLADEDRLLVVMRDGREYKNDLG
ncbi:MAG: amidohydrolase family protein [Streptosporangiales bacterium]|nr:amidohydrolase family protein [Streptosporangiales bacterium]